MTTIALPRPLLPHRPSSTLASLSSSTPLMLEPAAVPNKHIPVCPPGPMPIHDPDTPPPSPGKGQEKDQTPSSLLFPPDRFPRIDLDALSLYELNAESVAAALDRVSRQPLPEPCQVFPWLHGLHPDNQLQQTFFTSRRRDLRKTPSCLRGVTIVKANGNLTSSLLKGAIAPQEFLQPAGQRAGFLDVDPKDGFSVRNFHIQAPKAATLSDVIVYGDDDTDEITIEKLALDIAIAQQRWRLAHQTNGNPIPTYNTFVCTSPFREFEQSHPNIVAIDSTGKPTGNVLDLFYQERKEMYAMTKASEISHNVWMGPTPDPALGEADDDYDLMIECIDLGRISPASLKALAEKASIDETTSKRDVAFLEFPSSGSLVPSSWTQADADAVLETCKWIWHLAHGTFPSLPTSTVADADGDAAMEEGNEKPPTRSFQPFKILIHCVDGYTELSLLSIAYFSFSTGQPVADAWLLLHKEKRRNFFAYPQDRQLLESLTPQLVQQSPASAALTLRATLDGDATKLAALLKTSEPCWMTAGFDGSLPSRILDYMYLGNLNHANNPALLRAMGITQVLSVGETASWSDSDLKEWGEDRLCVVQGVQDNGIDQLTNEFGRCLDFIDRGRRNNTATLVHCRVGVSRSATICIAEVMRMLGLSFPRAYCFVRARRLNVIIQPHLKFMYELLRLEQPTATSGRELEWGEMAREVASLNRAYSGPR